LRSRNIKPGFFKNEILGTLDPLIGLTFAGLWTLADKRGRFEDRPIRIKGELFPYRDNVDVNGYLTVLEREGFIARYVVDGAGLIQVLKFEEHQSPHHTERESKLPAPPCKNKDSPRNGELTVNPPLEHGELTQAKRSDSLIHRFSDSLIPDSPKQTFSSELQTSSYEGGAPASKRAIDGFDDAVKVIFDYYLERTGRNSKTYEFTAMRKQKGVARLRECLKKTGGDISKATALMKLAIDGLCASDWHMGLDVKTNGKRYCEWVKHLFGTYEAMERWWNADHVESSTPIKPNGKALHPTAVPAETPALMRET